MLALTLCIASLSPLQTNWYVDAAASGSGTGTSADPYSTIQSAVDAATTVDGDTILVRTGTYAEQLVVDGKQIDIFADPGATDVQIEAPSVSGARSVIVRNVPAPGVHLAGFQFAPDSSAFVGNGIEVESATLKISRSEISKLGNGPDGALVCEAGSEVRLIGCTFQDCRANMRGGAITFRGTSLYVDACTFRRNEASNLGFGGAIWGQGSGTMTIDQSYFTRNLSARGSSVFTDLGQNDTVIRNTTFFGNGDFNTSRAGGIYGRGVVQDCEFEGNAGQASGAIEGSWEISGSLFLRNGGSDSGNWASAFRGSGVSTMTDCVIREHTGRSAAAPPSCVINATLLRCTFENNSTLVDGQNNFQKGGGAITNCSATDCYFFGNRTSTTTGIPLSDVGLGGAAYQCDLTNCVLVGNRAALGGGAFACTLVGCTLVHNVATIGGGAIGTGVMDSCIAFLNTPDQLTNAPVVTWSCVEGGAAGVGNIALDPRFVGPNTNDLRLLSDSPCIDTGNPSLTDPDGSRRDMGAFPFDSNPMGEPGAFCFPGPDSDGCTPTLSVTTPPSVSGTFVFEATGLGQASAAVSFIASDVSVTPYQNGKLCIGGTVRRGPMGLRIPGQSGPCSTRFDFIISASEVIQAGLLPGDRLYAQVLYRDAGSAQGIGITAAWEAIVHP